MFVLGLAPAAHGGNRTGRIFTGDRSGDFLFAALYATGFANQPTSIRAGDGLALTDLYVAAAVRCAPPMNRPTNMERDNCAPYLVRELAALHRRRASSSPSAHSPGTRLFERSPPRPDGDPPTTTAFRTWRRGRHRAVSADRLIPSEPKEHVHRQAQPVDARSRPSARPRDRTRLKRLPLSFVSRDGGGRQARCPPVGSSRRRSGRRDGQRPRTRACEISSSLRATTISRQRGARLAATPSTVNDSRPVRPIDAALSPGRNSSGRTPIPTRFERWIRS